MKKEIDSPHVIAPPPLIYILGLVFAFVLRYLLPLQIWENVSLVYFGWSLISVSIILFISALTFFIKNRTNVDPRKSTTFIIKDGPYRFSRNPIYVAMTLLYLGVTILVNDLWYLIMLLPILLIIQYGVIKREEAYLERKFGEKYIQYKKSVRRWL